MSKLKTDQFLPKNIICVISGGEKFAALFIFCHHLLGKLACLICGTKMKLNWDFLQKTEMKEPLPWRGFKNNEMLCAVTFLSSLNPQSLGITFEIAQCIFSMSVWARDCNHACLATSTFLKLKLLTPLRTNCWDFPLSISATKLGPEARKVKSQSNFHWKNHTQWSPFREWSLEQVSKLFAGRLFTSFQQWRLVPHEITTFHPWQQAPFWNSSLGLLWELHVGKLLGQFQWQSLVQPHTTSTF